MSRRALIISLSLLCVLWDAVAAHGFLSDPPQRGNLVGRWSDIVVDRNAPADPYLHFPAGRKGGGTSQNVGSKSQEKAGNFNWTPYDPSSPSFVWRAGVCGDEKGKKQDHLRGGIYYYNATIVRTYQKDSVIGISVKIISNHRGIMELFLCDVDKCGGEISEQCFQKGHCFKLKRAQSRCDSRTERRCGPIDEKYPGRWYFPCGPHPEKTMKFNTSEIRYELPKGLSCAHCVLQWYWASAQECRVEGILDYLNMVADRGQWRRCTTLKRRNACGGRFFPQEYYQCADVRIV